MHPGSHAGINIAVQAAAPILALTALMVVSSPCTAPSEGDLSNQEHGTVQHTIHQLLMPAYLVYKLSSLPRVPPPG